MTKFSIQGAFFHAFSLALPSMVIGSSVQWHSNVGATGGVGASTTGLATGGGDRSVPVEFDCVQDVVSANNPPVTHPSIAAGTHRRADVQSEKNRVSIRIKPSIKRRGISIH